MFYNVITQCLREPSGASYGGGIIVNPGFDQNIKGWEAFGQAKVEERRSKDGNRFIVARGRARTSDSFSQKVQVEQGKIYSFSGTVNSCTRTFCSHRIKSVTIHVTQNVF